jgi:hypothetical protein
MLGEAVEVRKRDAAVFLALASQQLPSICQQCSKMCFAFSSNTYSLCITPYRLGATDPTFTRNSTQFLFYALRDGGKHWYEFSSNNIKGDRRLPTTGYAI